MITFKRCYNISNEIIHKLIIQTGGDIEIDDSLADVLAREMMRLWKEGYSIGHIDGYNECDKDWEEDTDY